MLHIRKFGFKIVEHFDTYAFLSFKSALHQLSASFEFGIMLLDAGTLI
jgi:hypothetical protein